MARKPTNRGGKFIYALIEAGDHLPRIAGIGQSPVYTLNHGRIGAVVSDLFATRVRPERRNLTAHQTVLRQLGAKCTVLPMQFGVLAQGSKAVLKLLADNETEIVAQIHKLRGAVEMGLRLKWQVDNIYDYFVNTHPELKQERDRCLNARGGDTRKKPRSGLANRDEMIELGRFYERLLQAQRNTHKSKVESVLQENCRAIRSLAPKNERDVVNLACLVNSDCLDAFEQQVIQASTLFDDHYVFSYTGPWAPHNFVDIRLDPTSSQRASKQWEVG